MRKPNAVRSARNLLVSGSAAPTWAPALSSRAGCSRFSVTSRPRQKPAAKTLTALAPVWRVRTSALIQAASLPHLQHLGGGRSPETGELSNASTTPLTVKPSDDGKNGKHRYYDDRHFAVFQANKHNPYEPDPDTRDHLCGKDRVVSEAQEAI
jgi:hypothetical protein